MVLNIGDLEALSELMRMWTDCCIRSGAINALFRQTQKLDKADFSDIWIGVGFSENGCGPTNLCSTEVSHINEAAPSMPA